MSKPVADLESMYQDAIANVPRSREKDNGFRETDLINEITKRMTAGTDREKWLAAAALIDRKTKEGSTPKKGNLDLGDGKSLAYEPDRLMRWEEWLIEWKFMTLPWMEAQTRQLDQRHREAQAEHDRATAECDEAMELFSGLPDDETLTTTKAANIKYRQGSELACKWLFNIHRADSRVDRALLSAAVAEHPNWQETKSGHFARIDKSQPDDLDGISRVVPVNSPAQGARGPQGRHRGTQGNRAGDRMRRSIPAGTDGGRA
jgi:hypothetical protein